MERNAGNKTGQAVAFNNASNFVHPVANQSKSMTGLDRMKMIDGNLPITCNAVEHLIGKVEKFINARDRWNIDFKSHFDAMYAKILEETGTNVPCDNAERVLSHIDNSAENISKADLSDIEIEESELIPFEGPEDLVLILNKSLFGEGEEIPQEPEDGDNTCSADERKDRENESLDTEVNMASEEREEAGDKFRNPFQKILKIRSVNYKARRQEPVITVDQSVFCIIVDVSFYDIENIQCNVGEKLSIRANVSKENDYGFERHEFTQVFELPALVDRAKFTACIENGLLRLKAPMKQRSEALPGVFSGLHIVQKPALFNQSNFHREFCY